MTTPEQYRRKSQIAGGICVITLFFLMETYSADQKLPNPASVYIWAVLVLVAVIAAGLGVWYRSCAGKA